MQNNEYFQLQQDGMDPDSVFWDKWCIIHVHLKTGTAQQIQKEDFWQMKTMNESKAGA